MALFYGFLRSFGATVCWSRDSDVFFRFSSFSSGATRCFLPDFIIVYPGSRWGVVGWLKAFCQVYQVAYRSSRFAKILSRRWHLKISLYIIDFKSKPDDEETGLFQKSKFKFIRQLKSQRNGCISLKAFSLRPELRHKNSNTRTRTGNSWYSQDL